MQVIQSQRCLHRFASFLVMGLLASASGSAADQTGATDAEIAHIVVTANSIDIDGGKLARSKTKNPEIKEFAERMVVDHTAVNKQASDLAKRLRLTPKDNATSKNLQADAKQKRSELKKLKGAEFDQAYVDREVAFHQTVLETIDQTLLPNAKNEELRALIERVRPAIVAHLQQAKQLQQGSQHGDHS